MKEFPFLSLVSFALITFLLGCQKKETNSSNEDTAVEESIAAVSLLGKELFPRSFSDERRSILEKNLDSAYSKYNSDSTDEMNIIWYGRRLAYLDRYKEAIEVYSNGLVSNPQSFRLYRHRGHRYISTRELDKAIADLTMAAELSEDTEPMIEPDGIPNRLNTPLTTTQWNIYYHLGLAHYLNGDFESAIEAYLNCYEMTDNADGLVAISDWLYMALRRNGITEESDTILTKISSNMTIIENDSYLRRLLMYKGELQPEDLLSVDEDDPDADLSIATQGYGVGNWNLYNGDTATAFDIYYKIIQGDYWPAFGYIAAEADLARLVEE